MPGVCWGDEHPDVGIDAQSWDTWENDNTGLPVTVWGDADWGSMVMGLADANRSPVVDTGYEGTKDVSIAIGKYASPMYSGFTLDIRGSNSVFAHDAVSPAWEAVTSLPVAKDWRYIQVRFIDDTPEPPTPTPTPSPTT